MSVGGSNVAKMLLKSAVVRVSCWFALAGGVRVKKC